MGQSRYFEYLADDSTLDINQSRLGINEPGLYRGFDFQATPNLNLTLTHDGTGAQKTLLDKTLSNRFGVIITQQGTIINEDAPVALAVSATGNQIRTDLIVCEHEYIETAGGKTALYLVIEGAPGGAVPALTKPAIQQVIGTLRMPANCLNLMNTNVVYERPLAPAFAGSSDFLRRRNGSLLGNLDAAGHKITNLGAPTADGDAVNLKYLNEALYKHLPKNVVVFYEGSINEIPEGWVLQNGQNGTSDMRDRFVVAAGGAYEVLDIGGEDHVTLETDQLPSHAHSCSSTGAHSHSGTTASAGSHSHSAATAKAGSHAHLYRDRFFAENANMGTGPGWGTEQMMFAFPGSDSGYDVDNKFLAYTDRVTGENAGHTHTVTVQSAGSHAHNLQINSAGNHAHTIGQTGEGKSHENRPKYFALAPIKKI